LVIVISSVGLTFFSYELFWDAFGTNRMASMFLVNFNDFHFKVVSLILDFGDVDFEFEVLVLDLQKHRVFYLEISQLILELGNFFFQIIHTLLKLELILRGYSLMF